MDTPGQVKQELTMEKYCQNELVSQGNIERQKQIEIANQTKIYNNESFSIYYHFILLNMFYVLVLSPLFFYYFINFFKGTIKSTFLTSYLVIMSFPH